MAWMASYSWMLSHQGVELFERVRGCVLVGENVPLRVDFTLGPPPLLTLSTLGSECTSPCFSSTEPACLSDLCHDDNGLVSEIVSKPPIKCFLLWVAMAMVSLLSNRTVTKSQHSSAQSPLLILLPPHTNPYGFIRAHVDKSKSLGYLFLQSLLVLWMTVYSHVPCIRPCVFSRAYLFSIW